MNLNPDDPQLTAYALGELEPAERAAIETELQNSPELRQAVEEIRQTANGLREELAIEPCPELSPTQREVIDTQLQPSNVIRVPRWRFVRTLAYSAAAAGIMAALAWQFWFAGPEKKSRNQLAKTTTKTDAVQKPAPLPSVDEPRKVDPAPAVVATKNVPPPAPTKTETTKHTEPVPVLVAVDDKAHEQVDALKYGDTKTPAPTLDEIATSASVKKQAESPTLTLQNTQAKAKDSSAAILTLPPPASSAQSQIARPVFSGAVVSQSAQEYRLTASDSTHAASSGNVLQAGTGDTFNPTPSISMRETQAPASLSPAYNRRGGSAGGGGGGGGAGGSFAGRGNILNGGLASDDSGARNGWNYATPAAPPQDYYRLQRGIQPYTTTPPETAAYPQYAENTFNAVAQHPLSTFSLDVDTASYANVRRFLNENRMPPRDAVRIEEMVNYFSYQYPKPRGDEPFAADIEVAGCPWNTGHRLVRIGVQGCDIAQSKRPAGNFVFLIDVSGSMETQERLPLIKSALRQLVKKMNANDRVAIVVYASEAGVKLESTPCSEKEKILAAIDSLRAGGSTNGGDGIQQAYRVAKENFIDGGVNRVLLCTDGDFNVGMTDQNQLVKMIEEKAKSGVFLTTLGVGTDNYKDALMQKLADKGNGNYFYLDTLEEAEKVLIDQMNGTLVTIAKDVKVQIEFNPARVSEYRLVGYEKRMLKARDFNNDAKDAGEIGAGHTITALYEIVPQGGDFEGGVDDLKYQKPAAKRVADNGSKELLTLKLRYKQPDGDRSRLLECAVVDKGINCDRATEDFKFAAAVASFGMLLQDSEFKGNATYSGVRELAQSAKGPDDGGYRSEFINLVRKAESQRGWK